ncbi:hypothetical protein CL614_10645 [archaeon]|nr:hypothetical protein [archaeon]|tara:strand:+ start:94 stop:402 length:309 start_codon:yes stop_codon:yes gene_type:complete
MDNIFGAILAISFSGAYIPQIVKMIRRKRSSDVSLMMLFINAIGYYCGLGYVLMKEVDAIWLTLNYVLGFSMTALCIITWSFYSERILMGGFKNWILKKWKK